MKLDLARRSRKRDPMRSWRVDEIPSVLVPPFLVYSYGVALLLFLYVRLVRLTSRIEIDGREHLEGRNYILCHWHCFIPVYFAVFNEHRRHAWMQHPFWFMKPIHILLRWIGVERITLGSSGHGGRHAADELVELLGLGYSTAVFPDGPAGPPFVARKGVIHMSRQSGVPIVPVHFSLSSSFPLPTWDGKVVPLPFGRIKVTLDPPLQLDDLEIDEATSRLEKALGGSRLEVKREN